MRILAILLFFICLVPNTVRAETISDVIGVILELEGTGEIQHGNLPSAPAGIDMAVKQNDVLRTGPASRMFIQFVDGTEITLSENAEFVAEDYMYDEANNGNSGAIYRVTKGAFFYLSGLLTKNNPAPDVTVNVPQGSIGIRGTAFWGGDIDGAYGILVNDGVINVANDAGSQVLGKGQGTNLKSRNIAPSPVKIWPQAKIDRAVKTIALANPKKVEVKKKISEGRTRNLREKHQAQVRERMTNPVSERDKSRVAKKIRLLNKKDDGAANETTPQTIKTLEPILNESTKNNDSMDRLQQLQQLNQKQKLTPDQINILRQKQLEIKRMQDSQQNKADALSNQLNNTLQGIERPITNITPPVTLERK